MTQSDNTRVSRSAAKAQRREAILDAAKVLFARNGFRSVSIDEIGNGAGVSGPAVYRHFASKEAILSELLVGISAYLKAGGGHIVENRKFPSGEDVLGHLIDFHVEFAVSEPELIRIQDRDFAQLPQEARSRVRLLQRAYIDRWVSVLTSFSDLNREQARVRVHAVFGMMNSTPYVVRRESSAVIMEQLRIAARLSLGISADG